MNNGPLTPPLEEQRNVGDPIDLRELFRLIRRRSRMIAAITLLTVAAAGLFELRRVPQYRAEASIRLADPRQALGGQLPVTSTADPFGRTIDPLLSQLEVLRSRAVLGEVVDRLPELRLTALGVPLDSLDELVFAPEAAADTLALEFATDSVILASAEGRAAAAYGDTVALGGITIAAESARGRSAARLVVRAREAAVDRVARGLRITPRSETDVVDVVYTDIDPGLAHRVAGAAVETFADFSARVAALQAEQRREFIAGQLAHTRAALDTARSALTAFRRRTSAFSTREQLSGGQADLTALELRRADLEAESQVYRSLLGGLRAAGGSGRDQLQSLLLAPDFATNPVVSQLSLQLATYEATRDSLRSGPWAQAETHPDIRRLDALIAAAEGKLVGAVRGKLTTLDARIAALDALRERAARSLRGMSGREAEEADLVASVESSARLADELGREYQAAELEVAMKAGFVEVLDPPTLPPGPIGAAPAFRIAGAAVLGLLLAVAIAMLVEHLVRPISRPQEIESTLQISGLVVIPRLTPRRRAGLRRLRNGSTGGSGTSLVTLTDPRSTAAEAFRGLRTKIVFARADAELTSFTVTSPHPGDGKTTVAANLAAAYAQQGRVVLLVDGDLRRPSQHRVFDVPRAPGLAELIAGRTELRAAIHRTSVPHLWCLPAGESSADSSALLGNPRFGELITLLRAQFDIMIVDSPPLLATADPLLIARHTGGVLLVMHAGLTTTEMAQASLRHLSDVRAEVVGAVLNDPDDRVQSVGEYYGYSSVYASDGAVAAGP